MPTTYLWQTRLTKPLDEELSVEVKEFDFDTLIDDVRACGDNPKAMVKLIIERLSELSHKNRLQIVVICYKKTLDEHLVNHAFNTAMGCV